ncbi:MAG: aspartate/glutamate racemase family protein [Candidatus Limiplasma sp.]|nr:aspartate/glutamate racemase family protein [Candidatus Limiplasma sp.]
MKTIGLIGGMSWESTVTYYQTINQRVNARLGGYHSGKVLLYSVDFAEVELAQRREDWQRVGELLADAAARLERGGADLVLLGTNTMHKCAHQIQAAIGVPLVHIADATAAALLSRGARRVALLGTRYTMEQDFIKDRLATHGITVDVPTPPERDMLHRVIFEELCFGKLEETSRQAYLAVIHRMAAAGAQAAVLGCTEIGMLVRQADTSVPLVDTTVVHAEYAVGLALEA